MNLKKNGTSYWRLIYRKVSIILLAILLSVFGTLTYSGRSELQTDLTIQPTVHVKEFSEMTRITAYNPVPWQTDSDPHIASCGPNVQKQVAVSRDLFFNEHGEKHLCGEKITVVTTDGHEFDDYVINDTLNARFTNTVDVMLPEDKQLEARRFGVKEGYILW